MYIFTGIYYVSVYLCTAKFSEIYKYSGLYVYAYSAYPANTYSNIIYVTQSPHIYIRENSVTLYTCVLLYSYTQTGKYRMCKRICGKIRNNYIVIHGYKNIIRILIYMTNTYIPVQESEFVRYDYTDIFCSVFFCIYYDIRRKTDYLNTVYATILRSEYIEHY